MINFHTLLWCIKHNLLLPDLPKLHYLWGILNEHTEKNNKNKETMCEFVCMILSLLQHNSWCYKSSLLWKHLQLCSSFCTHLKLESLEPSSSIILYLHHILWNDIQTFSFSYMVGWRGRNEPDWRRSSSTQSLAVSTRKGWVVNTATFCVNLLVLYKEGKIHQCQYTAVTPHYFIY